MKTNYTSSLPLRRLLLAGAALMMVALLITFSTPVTQVLAGGEGWQSDSFQQQARRLAGGLLSYAPKALRTTLGLAPGKSLELVAPATATGAGMLSAFTKTANPPDLSSVAAGSTITYTITLENNDLFDDFNALLTDAVPANTTFVSLSISQQPAVGANWICAKPAVGGTGAITCQPSDGSRLFYSSLGATSQMFQVQYIVAVNPTLPVGTMITGSAAHYTADSGDPATLGGPENTFTSQVVNTVVHSTELKITKTDSPHAVFAGNNISYTITVKNNGPSQAAIGELLVTDPTPANTTTVTASGTGALAGCTAALLNGAGCPNTAAALEVGESATVTYLLTVNANAPNGFINNTATVTTVGAQVSDPNLTNNAATTNTGVGPNADLQLTKTATAGPVTAGVGTITYTINVNNSGPSNANGVVVTDNVPANTSVSSGPTWTPGAGAPAGSCAVSPGGTITCSPTAAGGVLDAGQSATVTYAVTVGASVPSGTLITNAANIASTGSNATPDPNPANNTQNATSTIVNTSANLAITKTGPPTAIAGNNITYTLTVTNPTGLSDAQNVVITDTLPALATFVSVTSSDLAFVCTAPSVGTTGTINCTKPTLASGASTTITVVVKVSPATPANTIISNAATVGSTTPDPNTANNTSATVNTTITTSATLTIAKSDAPDPVVAGTNMTFTVTVANNGPSDAQSVVMTDPLPANTSFVSVTGTGVFAFAGACTHNGAVPGVVTCTALPGGVLPAGNTATAIIVVKVASSAPVSPPQIVNTASVSSPTDAGSPRTATSSTTVRREADMSLTKTAPSSVIAGQNLDYTLTVKNNGPSDVAGGVAPGTIVVTDNLPVGASFVSASITGPGNFTCTATGQAVTCLNAAGTPGDFAAGSVVTIVIKAMAAKNLADNSNLNNSATVALTGPEVDPVPGNNTGAASTVVHTSADLQIVKDVLIPVPPAGVVAGQNITYRLRVLNNGPSNAQNVVVTDILPGNTTFVPGSITGTGVFAGAACTYNPAGGTNGSITCVPNASAGPPPTVQGEFTCGVEETITFQVQVNASVSGGVIVPNPARINSTTSDPNAGNNTSLGTSTVVIAQSNLAISKTVFTSTAAVDPGAPVGAVIPGTLLTYRIKITNNGPSDVINVLVSDTLPPNAKFVEVHRSGGLGTSLVCTPPSGVVDPNGNGGIVNCTAPLLSSSTTPTPGDPAGALNMALIDLTVFIDPATKVSLVNNATISATTNNFNQPVSATTQLTTPVSPTSDLLVTKTHTVDDTVALTNTAGNTLTYTLTVKNNGQSTAQMVNLVDTLPAGQTLAAAPDVSQAAGMTCAPNTIGSGGVITCSGGTLAPNATAIVKLLVKIDPCQAPGIYNNTATATSMSFDPNLANSTFVDPVTVVARADLSITKTASATVISGNTLTYNIEATNNGPSCALDVMITDPLPPNTVLISAVPSAGGVIDPSSPAVGANGTVKVTWPGLTSPGVKRTLAITLRVGADVTCDTVLTNTATVSYTPRIPVPNPNPAIVWDIDPVAGNNTATVTTTAQAQSDLSIVKTGPTVAAFSTPNTAGTVTYTLNFSNAGPSNAAGVMIIDTLPKGFTVVGTPTSTYPGTTFTITTVNGVTTVKANLGVVGAANQVGTNLPTSGTITIVAKVPDKHPVVTVTNVATISTTNCLADPNLANNTSSWDTAIVPPGNPNLGAPFPAGSEVSDQKAGSVLFYPIYTSDASNPASQNARITLTNISDSEFVTVHLFVVDGSTCSVLDSFVSLTPNQTTAFLASDFDPGNTGYMVAVAVDSNTGLPIAFNCLIGDVSVKFSSGHAANLGAEGISALMWSPAGTDPSVTSTTLKFDGMSYNRLPRVLALDSIGSMADNNSTMLIVNRVGGDFQAAGAPIGNFLGNLYDDTENAYSFTAVANSCQFRSLLSNNFPRTFVRLAQAVPTGRTGWMKFWALEDRALFGAAINYNASARVQSGAFNQGHNLHKLTLTGAATITVPVFIPN